MSNAPVLYARDGHVGTITLNRPDNRNSMTSEVLGAFNDIIATVREDTALRALIVTGSGKTFCAGADFASGGTISKRSSLGPVESFEASFAIYQPFLQLVDIKVPVLAAMNGHAIGGGLGLAVVCDIRIANQDAKYGANFARLGIHSGMSISYLLPRLIGVPRAAELLFTGEIMSGQRAAEIGLVNYAVPADEVYAKTMEMAQRIAANGPLAVQLMKKTFYLGLNWDPKTAARAEAWAQNATLGTQDSLEGIQALLEKREPDFKGR